jgi:hypothetical protein
MGTKKSVNIVNRETSPLAILNKKVGIKRVFIDEVEVATGDLDLADVVLFGAIPSNAVITSIKLFSDDLDSNGSPALAWDVGLYYSGIGNLVAGVRKASGDVVDIDCFATAVTVGQAVTSDVANVGKVGYECRFEVANIDTIDQEAWEIGGLTSDCGGHLFIGLTVSTAAATAVAGGMKILVEYLQY